MDDPILSDYIKYRAAKAERSPDQVAREISREAFYQQLYDLHKMFMTGEMTLGTMATKLGITKTALIHLLDKLQMPVTNI